eukprot:GFYU01002192.1.p1 GENE.GFYU01002192.1~~GFYU01002192.1.p1  ORF type:complete len:593 (-),score=113.74 GFYU01002192.1:61-1839(-)
MAVREAFDAFLVADEVEDCRQAIQQLISEANVDANLGGRAFFCQLKANTESSLSFKQKKVFNDLEAQFKRRSSFLAERETKSKLLDVLVNDGLDSNGNMTTQGKVLISGAGPVGLRAAVECALLGMHVDVVEKRRTFSRANILNLWRQTLDDLLSCCAKAFLPNLQTHGMLHCGTREIQLVLLKVCLLLGVNVHYNKSLQALQRPTKEDNQWKAVLVSAESARTVRSPSPDTATSDALKLKPNKTGDYIATGKCNAVDTPEVDASFFQVSSCGEEELVATDAFLIAEGEWSQSARKLGVKKTVDKFKQAIGLVINMKFDPSNPVEKAMQSFNTSLANGPSEKVGELYHQHGIVAENLSYLKGSTHYLVSTIQKKAFLEHGVLTEDRPSVDLLTADNVNYDKLIDMGRRIASTAGLPASTEFFQHNPVQIFDFSTRARCVAPAKYVGWSNEKNTFIIDDRVPEVVRNSSGLAILPCMPIGDALYEPFWPQGLGSNRGFHGALDAVYSVLTMFESGLEASWNERTFSYTCMNAFAWMPTRINQEKHWSVDPVHRYNYTTLKAARDMMATNAANNKQAQPPPTRVRSLSFAQKFS